MEVLHKAFREIDVAQKVCFKEFVCTLMEDAAFGVAATPPNVVLCIVKILVC